MRPIVASALCWRSLRRSMACSNRLAAAARRSTVASRAALFSIISICMLLSPRCCCCVVVHPLKLLSLIQTADPSTPLRPLRTTLFRGGGLCLLDVQDRHDCGDDAGDVAGVGGDVSLREQAGDGLLCEEQHLGQLLRAGSA